jgi:TldD protein
MTDTNTHFSDFGIDNPRCAQVLSAATKFGADHAELYFEHTITTALGLADHVVNQAYTNVALGVGIRVIVGDQVGYAYTEDLSLFSMMAAANTAAQIAHGDGSPSAINFTPSSFQRHYPVANAWGSLPIAKRLPIIRAWEERAFAADPRVVDVQLSMVDADKYILIVDSEGRIASDYQPMTRAFVMLSVEEGGLRESANANIAARSDLSFYSPERCNRMVDDAVKNAMIALKATSPPAGEMPVVLGAGSSGILLHEAIGHGMEADFNRKGISIFSDKIGEQVAPKGVTIIDDGTIPHARGSINVDDEGVASERTVLVEDGIMRSYLHDRISAKHYGVAPTGSGRRQSFRQPPLPRMRSTYMESGEHHPDEIIRSVKRGLYCDTFSNGQVQIGAGDFSFFVRSGWLIEDGKLTQPVKDVNLIGNGPDVLKTIDMVGNDMKIDEGGWTCGKDGQSVPVSQGMPTVKVHSLSVGGGR